MPAIGADVNKRLSAIFTVGAAVAGVASALLAQSTQFVGLDSLSFARSAACWITSHALCRDSGAPRAPRNSRGVARPRPAVWCGPPVPLELGGCTAAPPTVKEFCSGLR